MQSPITFQTSAFKERIKEIALNKWDNLTDSQRNFLIKIFKVITYKWRWQIAMNIPYLVIFALDKTIPAVHQFDMNLLASVVSRLHIPAFASSWMGLS